MTAEEFYMKWIKGIIEKHSERYAIMLQMRDDFYLIFAEAYFKHRVNEISDENKKLINMLKRLQSRFDNDESRKYIKATSLLDELNKLLNK